MDCTPSFSNDNGFDGPPVPLLRSALRIGRAYGRGASRRAFRQAHASFFARECEACRWWLSVARMLERMAEAEFACEREARPIPKR